MLVVLINRLWILEVHPDHINQNIHSMLINNNLHMHMELVKLDLILSRNLKKYLKFL